ncbi:lyase family protein [Corynebacterium cystitidis]|uniref:3-carboxy-cis,cis-muconate cycloisomerase n=1 Tax=Corynebacterium cystitidis DSM 20524 TaxID=1121357 RepID=A0A1H9SPL5_9CORY|nr:lyase family protein [Corynebacterium cystitidis]WJY83126.1 3-carboxy-cis,cis-muconate cycloisomerase [Corynebacterium cystitidis DSM 20524]SER86871.1 3-carboxy-cis,cis-muconate cycloisomerase [Corynebacterium cystitidis DSM 20524]SNV66551.1 3-carboxy-cis,cis-muconate cycloisomerase [Corynebacterium cystitidis]
MDSLSRTLYSDLASGSTTVHAALSDDAFINAIVEFEAALVEAAESTGKVTAQQAADARVAFVGFTPDLEEIAIASASGANPTIPLVKQLKARAHDPTAIHIDATSQDGVDTALSLCLSRAVALLIEDTRAVEKLLANLARTHRNDPIMARTLGQQALPTTFGAVAAGWLDGVRCARKAVQAVDFPVQYAGPVGALPGGVDIHDELAQRLGLSATPLVWHTNRQPLAELSAAMARLAGAVRKIAGDIVAYSATEVGELREPAPGGSSSMPHKANPAASVAADGYARRTPGLVATIFDALDCRGQRGVGSWHAEWQPIREIVAVTASAVNRITAALDGLEVHTEAMVAACGNNPDTAHAAELVDAILETEVHP